MLELYTDRVYDANIASAAKTTARQRFSGAFRCDDRDWDGGDGSREYSKTTRPGRQAAAPRATFAKDATKDSGKIRDFAEFCIDEEGTSPLDNIKSTCVRYLA
eukprot:jgi/Tetstr1/427602/TSEL_017727.t1